MCWSGHFALPIKRLIPKNSEGGLSFRGGRTDVPLHSSEKELANLSPAGLQVGSGSWGASQAALWPLLWQRRLP